MLNLSACLSVCLQEMNLFRTSCATLFGYDWVGVPLVYTQASFSPPPSADVCVDPRCRGYGEPGCLSPCRW